MTQTDRIPHPHRRTGNSLVRLLALAAFGALAAAPLPANAAGPTPTGVWLDDTGDGAVEIVPCGKALCGRIVWLKTPTTTKGDPLTDQRNERASQRNRPICGLQVIGNLARQADGSYDAGWIYDPKQGKAFDVAVEVAKPNQLRVIGYLGTRLFSKTLIWTRAPAEIGRCAAPNQATLTPSR